jgi:hypothetical protein
MLSLIFKQERKFITEEIKNYENIQLQEINSWHRLRGRSSDGSCARTNFQRYDRFGVGKHGHHL